MRNARVYGTGKRLFHGNHTRGSLWGEFPCEARRRNGKLADGTEVTAICFDNAATTPAFKDVNEEVVEKLGTYAYVGQGKGQKSAAVTEFYEEARQTVLDFVHADPELYTAFFCSNTTDGLNKLSSALVTDKNDMVLSSRMEHYANDLPWRNRGNTIYAEVDENGRLRLDEMERLLDKYPVKYVSIIAASNVTGCVNDVHTLARMAHEHDALIIVDGAQLVPHRAFSLMGDTPEENIDFFVFSAHKMYAPYGGAPTFPSSTEPVLYRKFMTKRRRICPPPVFTRPGRSIIQASLRW